MTYYKNISTIVRKIPSVNGVKWIAPDEIFKSGQDLSGSGWAEEVDQIEAENLFSPKIEQINEEPSEGGDIDDTEPEKKPKRRYKK
jgi:hypothetical protein